VKTIILGGAACVWDDLARAERLCDVDCVIAINDAGASHNGHLDHWVSLHPEKFQVWMDRRNRRRLPPPGTVWFHRGVGEREVRRFGGEFQSTEDWGGSSGLFAVKVALEQGASHVILCGVPMDPEQGHYFDEKPWKDGRRYHAAWEKRREEMADRVRSMSGWTARLLGEPDEVWLSSTVAAVPRHNKERPSGTQGSN